MDKKKIGMVLVLVGFFIIGFLVKTVFFSDNGDAAKKILEKNKTKIERQVVSPDEKDGELPGQSKDNPNIESIDKSLGLKLPNEILKILPKGFEKSFREFMDESNLWTEGTTGTSDGYLIRDINNDGWEFNILLNNYGKTVITVKIDKNGNIQYLYR